jgi:predicted aldo/keto reductase-like oxidoreductase
MEPLRGGSLVTAPPPVAAIYRAHSVQRSPVDWAFRHLLDRSEVSCILSGVSTLDQLKEDIALFSAPDDAVPGCLSAADKAMITRVREEYQKLRSIPCTGCEYCMPCPNGVGIPGTFALYNDTVSFGIPDQSRRAYSFAIAEKRDASRCVECAACEQKCPQHIGIIDQLKVAHEKLKGWIE